MRQGHGLLNKTSRRIGAMVLGLILPAASPALGALRYVNAARPNDSGSGLSWATAKKTLQGALQAAAAGDEIWVATGTYRPDQGGGEMPGERTATFQLKNGVALFGGFAGTETALSQRNVTANATILSGDLNGDDDPPQPAPGTSNCCSEHTGAGCDDAVCETAVCENNSFCCTGQWIQLCSTLAEAICCDLCGENTRICENSYHVVTGSGTDTTAVIDGFTIAAGNADGDNFSRTGGGMRNSGGSPTVTNCTFSANSTSGWGGGMFNGSGSNSTVTNCTFSGNSATLQGAGMFNSNSSPTVSNCTFNANSANDVGGGMNNTNSSPMVINCTFTANWSRSWGGGMDNIGGSPTVTNCTFSGNSAGNGGAMSNLGGSNSTVADCTFIGNSAESNGGGMVNNSTTNTTVTNCMFSGNSAGNGGGISNAAGPLTLTNSTLSGNSAATGGGISNAAGPLTLSNCIFWNNSDNGGMDESAQINTTISSPVVNYSIVQGGWTGAGGIGNSSSDPMFIDADGDDNIAGTEDDNLRLDQCSPAIDAGDNSAVPGGITTDLDGNPRFVDDTGIPDTGNGTPPIVDMGAYEFQGTTTQCCANGIVEAGEGCDDGGLADGDGCSSTCTVESGYTCDVSEPSICTDIDECFLGTDNCDVNATCTNTPGSFTCACPSGYTDTNGDGTLCTDIDECTLLTDNCDVNATCTNTPGSFTCTCNAGYSGTGVICVPPPLPALGPHDIRKNRVISIDPNNANAIVMKVELLDRACITSGAKCTNDVDCDSGETCDDQSAPVMLGWVSDPITLGAASQLPEGSTVVRVQKDVPAFRVWSETVVHISDCEIAPAQSYAISASPDGLIFSEPLRIGTITQPGKKKWADYVATVESGVFTPPNGVLNVNDLSALLAFFQGRTVSDAEYVVTTLELVDETTTFVISASDLQAWLGAFGGGTYPPAAFGNQGGPEGCP